MYIYKVTALVAQLVRALPRMQKVMGSNPAQGSSFFSSNITACLGICIVSLVLNHVHTQGSI